MASNSPHPAVRILRGRILTGERTIADGLLVTERQRIAYCGPTDDIRRLPGRLAPDLQLPAPSAKTILPGLVDMHCHGAYGGAFTSGSEESARRAIGFLHSRGTTTLLASLVTAAPEQLLRDIRTLRSLVREGLLAGIHLEGPFLAPSHCGAHDPGLLLDPDLDLAEQLLAAGEGTLKTMTYAGELARSHELIDLLTRHAVIPSLGHTGASTRLSLSSLARARDGLTAAGRMGYEARPTVTHLFNGMPPMHHRAPGPVAACLREARAGKIVVELISDGIHLDPDTVRTVFELVGAENIALVTDSMAATGLGDGRYQLGGSPVTVRNGTARLVSTGSIAGGTATMLDVLRLTVDAGISLESALRSATMVPAGLLGLDKELGTLRAGLRADVLIVDEGLRLEGVMHAGEWITPVQKT